MSGTVGAASRQASCGRPLPSSATHRQSMPAGTPLGGAAAAVTTPARSIVPFSRRVFAASVASCASVNARGMTASTTDGCIAQVPIRSTRSSAASGRPSSVSAKAMIATPDSSAAVSSDSGGSATMAATLASRIIASSHDCGSQAMPRGTQRRPSSHSDRPRTPDRRRPMRRVVAAPACPSATSRAVSR